MDFSFYVNPNYQRGNYTRLSVYIKKPNKGIIFCVTKNNSNGKIEEDCFLMNYDLNYFTGHKDQYCSIYLKNEQVEYSTFFFDYYTEHQKRMIFDCLCRLLDAYNVMIIKKSQIFTHEEISQIHEFTEQSIIKLSQQFMDEYKVIDDTGNNIIAIGKDHSIYCLEKIKS